MSEPAYIEQAESLPFGAFTDLCGQDGGVVIMAPHPDDETLGCGGLIAQAAAHERPVIIIVMTDGTQSHPNSARFPAPCLAETRRLESSEAAKLLGLDPDRIVFLGLQDGALPASGEGFSAAVESVFRICQTASAAALFCTWRHDHHLDHKAAWRMAENVQSRRLHMRLWAYPVWGRALPAPIAEDAPAGVRLDIAAHLAAKQSAIRAHRSQVTDMIDDDPDGFKLSSAVISVFERPYEIFLAP
ncbi:MAG: PIG-L deacetylase family protein [Hyphomicrobiales bacterium]|nr:PIG-L deacetylase family protein [Hyphomicrobiales bacterium]